MEVSVPEECSWQRLMRLSLLCFILPGWWWVGISYEEGLTPAACSLERAFALIITGIVTVHLHVCDKRDCPCGRELHVDNCPV